MSARDLQHSDLWAVVRGRADTGLLAEDLAEEARRFEHYRVATGGEAAEDGDMPLDLRTAAAQEIMGLFGQTAPEVLFARRQAILTRAAAKLRAEGNASLSQIRHNARPADTHEAARRQPYARFFAVEEMDIGWRRFDGQMTPPITRAAFVSADAVTVLPYDPKRDRVLVVEQFRAGPYLRGDPQPWQIEAIAGRVDAGETPEDAARREAVEEAGLRLGELHKVAEYYPSPGILTEYLYSYVASADLPDGSAGVFGLAEEQEDIRGHVLTFCKLMQLVEAGEVASAHLILTALWLAKARAGLRKAARGAGCRGGQYMPPIAR
jgi:ADP-ribose pyrophosphatase